MNMVDTSPNVSWAMMHSGNLMHYGYCSPYHYRIMLSDLPEFMKNVEEKHIRQEMGRNRDASPGVIPGSR